MNFSFNSNYPSLLSSATSSPNNQANNRHLSPNTSSASSSSSSSSSGSSVNLGHNHNHSHYQQQQQQQAAALAMMNPFYAAAAAGHLPSFFAAAAAAQSKFARVWDHYISSWLPTQKLCSLSMLPVLCWTNKSSCGGIRMALDRRSRRNADSNLIYFERKFNIISRGFLFLFLLLGVFIHFLLSFLLVVLISVLFDSINCCKYFEELFFFFVFVLLKYIRITIFRDLKSLLLLFFLSFTKQKN